MLSGHRKNSMLLHLILEMVIFQMVHTRGLQRCGRTHQEYIIFQKRHQQLMMIRACLKDGILKREIIFIMVLPLIVILRFMQSGFRRLWLPMMRMVVRLNVPTVFVLLNAELEQLHNIFLIRSVLVINLRVGISIKNAQKIPIQYSYRKVQLCMQDGVKIRQFIQLYLMPTVDILRESFLHLIQKV